MDVPLMKFRNLSKTKELLKELLKEVNKCKSEELENLLHQIEKSEDKNEDLLMAKTMITSRLASIRS